MVTSFKFLNSNPDNHFSISLSPLKEPFKGNLGFPIKFRFLNGNPDHGSHDLGLPRPSRGHEVEEGCWATDAGQQAAAACHCHCRDLSPTCIHVNVCVYKNYTYTYMCMYIYICVYLSVTVTDRCSSIFKCMCICPRIHGLCNGVKYVWWPYGHIRMCE